MKYIRIYTVLVLTCYSNILKMLKIKIILLFTEIQYRKELKKTVTNNRVTYVMDILERQSEICVHDKNSNQLTVTNVKQSNDRNNNNKKRR